MNPVKELRSHPDPERTLALLQKLAATATGSDGLLTLHELLQFYKAYPRSVAIRQFCEGELGRFGQRVATLKKTPRAELAQTGIVGTEIYYPYDLEMARWLMARLGDGVEIDWEAYADRASDPLAEYLPLWIEPAEGDAVDDADTTAQGFIKAARGPSHGTSLDWVVDAISRTFPGPAGQQIYNAMDLSLLMTLTGEGPSRTLLEDGKPPKLFLWDPVAARTKFDLLTEIKRPLSVPEPVPAARGRALLDLAYGTLLPRLRELYPAIHGNPAEVYDIPLERGIRVILWFMEPRFRLPLEVGWGLVVLKNHVPIGYGAGGMLHDRSEIAINVFDTFRGGEAAWLYSQYARILNSLCHAPWLVTRRYQLGYENEEGLASGSFWFYDKLGFRSVDGEIRKLADAERAQIAKHKGYRTPKRILKKLCAADAVLSLKGESAEKYREFPLAEAGLLASRVIAGEFDGERQNLENRILNRMKQQFGFSYQGWTAPEKSRFAQMGLFVLAMPRVNHWTTSEKMTLFDFCRKKGAPREADYARAYRKNRRFFEELQRMIRAQG
ncbi:MAG TPA: hypothetical protein VGL38_00165 [bacterium]|jgi:hypothetical protein